MPEHGVCGVRNVLHANQMSRMLNRPFINLGFSGSGKGEPEMARTMADIKNPAMYVLDYDANAHCDGLDVTLPVFRETGDRILSAECSRTESDHLLRAGYRPYMAD